MLEEGDAQRNDIHPGERHLGARRPSTVPMPNWAQVGLQDQEGYNQNHHQTQGPTRRKGLCAATRDRLRRSFCSGGKARVGLALVGTRSERRLARPSYGCKVGLPQWRAMRGSLIAQPPGFVVAGKERKVLRLIKALYGPRQAPHAWYAKLDASLASLGFQRSTSEHAVYTRSKNSH